ncbi:MAG: glycosyltransferase family 39 protein [Anaerolineae bacterium]|nr:glycosyltransferase family 39 protein [Anaerolineae bacterium]
MLLGLAALGLVWRLSRIVTREKGSVLHLEDLLPRTIAGWGRVGTLLVAATVALAARREVISRDYTALFLWWLFAAAYFAVTLLLPLLRNKPDVDFPKLERYGLVALLLVAFLVRCVALGRIPVNLGGDEGTQLLDGLHFIERPLDNPFATGWYSVPTMSFLVYGVAMRFFGATVAGGRMLSALAGTVTVLITFLLARTLGGRRVGWVTALLLTVSHYHIHYSRLASNQIFDPLIGTLVLWLVWLAMHPYRYSSGDRGVRASRLRADESASLWGLAGLVAGGGWYGYFGARWVTLLLGLIVVWRMLVEPRFLARHWRGLALFVGAWLVVVLPLLGWYTVHPSALTERYNAVNIFTSGWMTLTANLTNKSAVQLLLQQLWKSATAFHFTFDPTFWYYPQLPLVDFITGAFMIVGFVAALLRVRWPSRAVTLLWFVSTLVMAWVLTENPPSSQRGLLLIPAATLLAAWGVEALWQLVTQRRRTFAPFVETQADSTQPVRTLRRGAGRISLSYAATVFLGALLVTAVLFNLGFYFSIYTPRRTYGNPTAEVATAFARFILAYPHPVGEQSPIYFFGPPVLYWDFGGLAFLLRDQPGVDVMPGAMPGAVSSPARFVFIAERLTELQAVKSAYPGGTTTELTAPDGRMLVTIYDW